MSSEVLPIRATTIIDPHSIESKNVHAATPLISATPLGPGPNAIFNVVPITTTTTTTANSNNNNNNTDDYGPYGKPNAIVRPVRRNESNIDTMILPEATAANQPASNQSTPKVNVPAKNKRREIDTFTKELDNKLRHLQKDKKPSLKNVKFIIFLLLFLFAYNFFFHRIFDCVSVWMIV